MTAFLQFIYILSLVCWIGSIVFFSFFAAPVIFKTLEREQAGEVVGGIFPKYYAIGYVCAVLALVALFAAGPGLADAKWVLVVVMLGLSLAAGMGVNPRARKLKEQMRAAGVEEREPLEQQFRSLHKLSVRLNGAVLLIGLGLLWLTATGLSL